MADFNPYHKWLGIPLGEQPANHYRLLGIEDFESDADVIETAAERQTLLLRTFQTGPNSELAERLLNEVSAARVCLLDGKSKARYDTQLRAAQQPVPEDDPLAFTTEELAAVPSKSATRSRQRSRGGKPVWKEPWAIPAAAGGIVVLLLLIMILFGSGESPKGSGQEQELQAEIASLKEKLVAAGNNKGEGNAELAKKNTELRQQNAELEEQIGDRSLDSSNIEEIPFELNSSENIKHPQFTYNLRGTYDGDIGMVLDPNKEIDLGKSWILRFTLTPPERPQKIRPFIVWGDNRPGLDALTIKYGEGLLSFSVTDCNNRSSKGGRLPVDLKMGAEIDISLEYSSRSKTIAITADGDREEVQLDFTPALDRESPLYIGIIQGYPGRFGGTVANFQFGNIERPARRDSGLPVFLKQGLIAYYPFNGNANDESGNGNDLEIQGATASPDRHGIKNSAYAFHDELKSYMTTKDGNKSLGNFEMQDFTLSAWVQGTPSPHGPILSKGLYRDATQWYFRLDKRKPDDIRVNFHSRTIANAKMNVLSIQEQFDASWHQLVAVASGTKLTLYIDGVVDTQSTFLRVAGSDTNLLIGMLTSEPHQYFNGAIDDIRIYNRALSEAEVKALYEFEKP